MLSHGFAPVFFLPPLWLVIITRLIIVQLSNNGSS